MSSFAAKTSLAGVRSISRVMQTYFLTLATVANRLRHAYKIGQTTKTLVEWSESTGLKANTILTRIRRGWPSTRLLEIANP